MTPVKIRGKRRGIPQEKWNHGKKRQKRSRSNCSQSSALKAAPSHDPRSRQWSSTELSRLEQLPTEIIQAVFEHSANINLPRASPALMAQLSNRHMYEILTSVILQPVLGCAQTRAVDGEAASSNIAAALRLFSCKFVTWPYFRDWLRLASSSTSSSDAHAGTTWTHDHFKTMWADLEPSSILLPPTKLLHGPWSDDRALFLDVLGQDRTSLLGDNSSLGEAAGVGLTEAILETHSKAVEVLLYLGVRPTMEMLRQAVIDAGCDQDIVSQLIKASHATGTIDILDPALWSWADRAAAVGNDKGSWLMALLKKNGGFRRPNRNGNKRH